MDSQRKVLSLFVTLHCPTTPTPVLLPCCGHLPLSAWQWCLQ